MKLVYRLLIFALGVITVFTTVSVMLVDKRLRDRMVNERAGELGRDARLIGGQWTKTADPQRLAARAAEADRKSVV